MKQFHAILGASLGASLFISGCLPAPPVVNTDKQAPALTEVTPVGEAYATSASYTFNSTEAGNLSVSGNCQSDTTEASKGDNTIIFSNLTDGEYDNCILTVTDASGNTSDGLAVSSFTVDMAGHAPTARYKKLDATGAELTIQNKRWQADGSENASTQWSCVLDTETNKMWEVKSETGTLRSKDARYTWYNTNPAENQGEPGPGDTGIQTTTSFINPPFNSSSFNGSDNCFDQSRCDTQKYTADVNASSGGAGLCGANDWRLPTIEELQTTLTCTYGVDCDEANAPLIDQHYFPNTQTSVFWSVSPALEVNYNFVMKIDHTTGEIDYVAKFATLWIRLVRDN